MSYMQYTAHRIRCNGCGKIEETDETLQNTPQFWITRLNPSSGDAFTSTLHFCCDKCELSYLVHSLIQKHGGYDVADILGDIIQTEGIESLLDFEKKEEEAPPFSYYGSQTPDPQALSRLIGGKRPDFLYASRPTNDLDDDDIPF